MPQQISSGVLSQTLKPLCPRDNHVMHYEAKGLSWREGLGGSVQSLSSYHCGYFACSVRYRHTDGYFTVVDTPDLPHFVEEPGTNILQCPRHGTWLYRSKDERSNDAFACGVEGCDYVHE